jgi:hypothetical protein
VAEECFITVYPTEDIYSSSRHRGKKWQEWSLFGRLCFPIDCDIGMTPEGRVMKRCVGGLLGVEEPIDNSSGFIDIGFMT